MEDEDDLDLDTSSFSMGFDRSSIANESMVSLDGWITSFCSNIFFLSLTSEPKALTNFFLNCSIVCGALYVIPFSLWREFLLKLNEIRIKLICNKKTNVFHCFILILFCEKFFDHFYNKFSSEKLMFKYLLLRRFVLNYNVERASSRDGLQQWENSMEIYFLVQIAMLLPCDEKFE